MNSSKTCLILALVLIFTDGTSSADKIILKGGYELKADVLKSDDQAVVVDLGFTVLRLDRSVVVQVISATESDTPDSDKPKEKTASEWQLYRTADLEPTTIEKNTERVGEAVVMVTSPGGQGSGFIVTNDGHPG